MNSTGGNRTAPQWWKTPIYHNPVVSPLERESELKRRLKQVELGKKVVQYLAELRKAEDLYREQTFQRESGQQRIEQNTPKMKGEEELF
uniref:Large ribosomal subunit protein mL52 n=1 Tax=Globodera rostochiensis TaxID=31243 RepID=A0A914GRP8_GLORO